MAITGSGSVAAGDAGVNDGMYIRVTLSVAGNRINIRFSQRNIPVRDNFLPIDVDNDCGICRFEEPYSHIVDIVLPSWQGRFINTSFRRFFERTLKLECPAHLVLNICWVNCRQMGEFELKYKKWLVENAKDKKDQLALSGALNELIDILVKLRTIYPEGTLHDCEVEESNRNSIILNNSVIGNL
jgi:hypothetical protein